ncbi:MAG: hypothetical protein AAF443_05225 [Chlamydiota bacterium]
MLGEIQVDYRGFFRDEKPYAPVISPCPSEGQVGIISIDLKLDSELKWKKLASAKESIFWQLNFGLNCPAFPWNSPVALSALKSSATCFVDHLLSQHKEQTLGICLYDGPIRASSRQMLANYLQQLAAIFPDEAPLFACFDPGQITSPTDIARLIAPDYFPYLYIGLTTSRYPLGILHRRGDNWVGRPLQRPSLGVVLPSEEQLSSAHVSAIDQVIDRLQTSATSYRIVYESQMSEQWDELDSLILFAATLSEQGKRKVRGFVAAGGMAVVVGKSLGVVKEMALETYLTQACVKHVSITPVKYA